MLLDLIKSQLSDQHYSSMSKAIGADSSQTRSAVQEALPVLLGALTQKASNNTGLDFLSSLLDRNHDGSVLDDILGMVTGGTAPASTAKAGQSALQNLLGSQIPAVEQHVAANSGLDASAVAKLLPMLAPIIMGALTKAQSSQNLSGASLASFLQKESGSIARDQPQASSFLTSMLDKNNDGSVVDDVLKMGVSALGGMFRK